MNDVRKIVLLLALVSYSRASEAQTRSGANLRPLWGHLVPGPYTVGFQVRYRLDPSRVWDADPNKSRKKASRPIRISVWYPAHKPAHPAMPFGEYFRQHAPTPYFEHLDSMIEHADIQPTRDIIFGKSDSRFKQLLALSTAAFRDASPLAGPFPLIAYSEGYNNRSHDNSVLAEYLASYGYVVLTVPQVGPRSTRLTLRIAPSDLETQARDVEFAIGDLQSFASVSGHALGVLGYSMGGVVAMWLAGRNPDVLAIVGLDPSFRAPQFVPLVMQSPYFDPRRLRMPLMSLQSGNPAEASAQDTQMVHALTLADRYVAQVGNAMHADFSDFAMYAKLFPLDVRDRTPAEAHSAHEAVCRYVLKFFDAVLKHDTAALVFLRKREANESGPFLIRMHIRDGIKAPTEEEFVALARSAGIAAAAALLRQAAKQYPGIGIIDQPTMNRLGYGLLEQGKIDDAVIAFTLNVEAHPTSADAYDSFAEGLIADGRREAARAAYERLLAVLPRDGSLTPAARDEYRSATQKKIASLLVPAEHY